MGLNSTFFISLSLISGLAALISIFRLAVGVQGSARTVCLMGVMWARSGVALFLFISKGGALDSADFSGVDLLLSVQMFSCDRDSCVVKRQIYPKTKSRAQNCLFGSTCDITKHHYNTEPAECLNSKPAAV